MSPFLAAETPCRLRIMFSLERDLIDVMFGRRADPVDGVNLKSQQLHLCDHVNPATTAYSTTSPP